MSKAKKASGKKAGPAASGIEVSLDERNPGTVVLSRWPEEAEKPEVEAQIEKLRSAERA